MSMVLEFCSNGTMSDLLCHLDGLEEKVARTYFKQLMSGLDAIHQAGYIHRFPSNASFAMAACCVVRVCVEI